MMKKAMGVLFGVSALLALSATCVLAHPPAEVGLEWKAADSALVVTVTHQVKDPAGHYVNWITVTADGKELMKKEYTAQTDAATQIDTIVLEDVTPGTELVVKANCNKGGALQQSIKIE